MKYLLLALATLPACDIVFHLDVTPTDPPHDSSVLPVDAGCTPVGKFGPGGTGMLTVCVPASATTLALTAIDTDDPGCLDSNQVCVIAGTTITLDAMVVTGSHSLVIAAAIELEVRGLIDLTHESWITQDCPSPGIGASGTTVSGGGGGGGGGWSSAAGHGGYGLHTAGGNGGSATSAPTTLRGGCVGAEGGHNDISTVEAHGAPGGSAIYLTSPRLVLAPGASINVSGHGGAGGTHGGSAGGGGGGGGSGGLIVFDASSIVSTSAGPYLANGGGGGGGGGAATGDGAQGLTAAAPAPFIASGGIAGNSVGTNGGDGASASNTGADAATSSGQGGGGGGGGGQGWILYYSIAELTGIVASPPAQRGSS